MPVLCQTLTASSAEAAVAEAETLAYEAASQTQGLSITKHMLLGSVSQLEMGGNMSEAFATSKKVQAWCCAASGLLVESSCDVRTHSGWSEICHCKPVLPQVWEAASSLE